MTKPLQFTESELAFMQANATKPRAELAALFNAQFNRSLTVEQVKGVCTRKGWKTGRTGCFEKGFIPANKGTKGLTGANSGSFKKGQKSHTQKPVGHEYVTPDGYIMIKVAEPNKFRLKHHVVWEQHFGPMPAGHAIKFKDDNSQNLDINNMVLMSRGELAVLNHLYSYKTAPAEVKPVLITLAKVKAKIGNVKRNASGEVASHV